MEAVVSVLGGTGVLLVVLGLFGICGLLIGIARGFSHSYLRGISVCFSAGLAVYGTGWLLSGGFQKVLSVGAVRWVLGVLKLEQPINTLLHMYPQDPVDGITLFGVLIGPVLFLVQFFVYSLITCLVISILSAFLRTSRSRKRLPSRLLGALIGTVQGLLIGALILIPVLGYNQVLLTAADQYEADAQNPDENKVYAFVNRERKSLEAIRDCAPARWLSRFGGSSLFGYLTRAQTDTQTVQLSEELPGLVRAYAAAQVLLDEDPTQYGAAQAEAADRLADTLAGSQALQHTAAGMLNTAAQKYKENGEFLGVSLSAGASAPLYDALWEVLESTNSDRVAQDMRMIADLLDVAVQEGLPGAFASRQELVRIFSDPAATDRLLSAVPEGKRYGVLSGLFSDYGCAGVAAMIAGREDAADLADRIALQVRQALLSGDRGALQRGLAVELASAGITVCEPVLSGLSETLFLDAATDAEQVLQVLSDLAAILPAN